MPIYEFHCKECRNEFKTLKRADQLNAVACPSCGTPKVARLLSVTARTQPTGDTATMPSMCNMGAACCGGGCRQE